MAYQLTNDKTANCTFISTHFTMGIGKLRQIKGLKVETTADKSKLRHQKQLMDSPELEEIRSQDGYMKRHLDSISCRYDEGTRFLPNVELVKAYKAMEAYRTIRRPLLVEKFMAVYRAMEASDFASLRDALGDTFRREDYPAADDVEAGFAFTFNLRPVGLIDLTGMPDFIAEAEIAKEAAKRQAAINDWTMVMRTALAGVVNQLFNALRSDPITGERKKLYDSHVENLMEFCRTFPSRNLGNDAECLKLRNQIVSLMSGRTVDMLRESEYLKDTVATGLAEVKANLNNLLQVSGRKFR